MNIQEVKFLAGLVHQARISETDKVCVVCYDGRLIDPYSSRSATITTKHDLHIRYGLRDSRHTNIYNFDPIYDGSTKVVSGILAEAILDWLIHVELLDASNVVECLYDERQHTFEIDGVVIAERNIVDLEEKVTVNLVGVLGDIVYPKMLEYLEAI